MISAGWTPSAVTWWRERQVRPGAQAHRRGRRADAPGGSLDPVGCIRASLPPPRRHRAGSKPGEYPEIAGGGRTDGGEAIPTEAGRRQSGGKRCGAGTCLRAARSCRDGRGGCYHKTGKCYHGRMRQLITRLDDDLHARLRERAAAEGRSVNALVVEILAAEVAPGSRRERLRRRARAAGWLIVPPRPDRAPSWEAVEEATRGAGTAVSEALEAERARR